MLLVLGMLVVLVSSAAWVRSVWWADRVAWRMASSEVATQGPQTFNVHAQMWIFTSAGGSLFLTLESYVSYLNDEQMRDRWLASWRGWDKWEVFSLGNVMRREEPGGWWFCDGWTNWRSKKAGVGFFKYVKQGSTIRVLELPLWGSVVLGSLMAFIGWRWRRRIRRRELGEACLRCGYDLAGIVCGSAGCVCPECGAAVGAC